MKARTIQTPPALRRDTRFQACTPGAKWVYGHICDREEIPVEKDLDVLGTVALLVEGLGDHPRAVLLPLLDELAQRGLVTLGLDRLLVSAPIDAQQRLGPRGGKSGALRTAEYRDRQRKRAAVENPSQAPVTVTAERDGSTRHTAVGVTESPSHTDACDGSARHTAVGVTETGASRHDPAGVTEKPSQNARCDGDTRHAVQVVTETPVTEPVTVTETPSQVVWADGSGGSSPASKVLSPHTPLSPNLSSPPPTEERGRGAQPGLFGGGDEEPSEPTPSKDLPEPATGSAAAMALGAIRGTVVLRTIVARPVRLAVALTNGSFPAVDVPQQIRAADAWLVANPANRKKNGARFVTNWLAMAQERAPRVAASSTPSARPSQSPVTASSPKDPRIGIQPPAPPSAFEHVALARALGVRWPGYEPTAETKEHAFLRITGRTIEQARAEVAAQAAAKKGATP